MLSAVAAARGLPSQYGEVSYYRDDIPGKITFEFTPISSGENAFFVDFNELVKKSPSLGTGTMLSNFYIISEDWASFEYPGKPQNDKLIKICGLIRDLSNVAVSKHTQKSCISLVFSTSSGNNKPPKTLVLETRTPENILKLELNKTSLVSSLASEGNKVKFHAEERRAIFNGAICEVIESIGDSSPDKFGALLAAWDKVTSIYWQNFQIYIHSFSFEKVRKEFAQAELDYGSKLSTALSDIAGKMLALPISLVAIITLTKATSNAEALITSLGLIITSVILGLLLFNQLLNIQRLNSSMSISFENLTKTIKSYPKNLQTLINNSKEHIRHQQTLVTVTIKIFAALSLIPMGAATLFLLQKYAQPAHDWLILNFHSA
ncbi:hypothetical protein [Pseudomonas syringae]|uniref:hypothetical protein n=1 Tax=Pseudomonas syringae TaxID=317 RepID=UPI0017809897|nr:hypothetical protein [Pseudomonas syringae]